MLIAVPAESHAGEKRTALVPDSVRKLTRAGFEVLMEKGAGQEAGFSDAEYEEAGARLSGDRNEILSTGDIVLRVRKPSKEDVATLKKGVLHISYLDPYNEKELIGAMKDAGVSAISMEMVPRTTRAQKMDALSSQANLAGYVMVVVAANTLNRIMPMMMTPAGTLSPVKVFVIGAGVAGLQAIATAKRMGARVTAFDTRPVVAEQVRSVGAKFLEIDLGETGETAGGYAKELTPEQIEKQQQGMAEAIADSDVVITTAQVFGRPAPRIVTKAMVEAMRPGSVVVDMAVESGGNVEGSAPDETVDVNGVSIIGITNLPSIVPRDASSMYSSNLFNLVTEYWDAEEKKFHLDLEDDIVKGCLITHEGEIVNETIKNL